MCPVETPKAWISRTPLKLTVITPRYHPTIIGGAEAYLRHFLSGLRNRGVDIRVLTTMDVDVRFENADTLIWANSMAAEALREDTETVLRFRSWNLPSVLRRRFSRAVERARNARLDRHAIETDGSYLGRGFYPLERWGSAFPFRWTGGRARVELRDRAIVGLKLEALALRPLRLSVSVDGGEPIDSSLPANQWSVVDIPFAERSSASVDIEASPTYRPPNDDRELGVALRAAELRTACGGVRIVPLHRDRNDLISRLSTSELAPQLDLQGCTWGYWTSCKDALLKGPVSPALGWAALSHALRSDVVLATHAPFLTLGYGWAAGRLARRPTLLMPFFHLRDPYHYRPWLRGLLGRADRVLCLNHAMKSFVESQWGASASVLGGGVDPAELESPGISGRRFRRRHGLDDRPLVLMVARKVQSKGYAMVCEAVHKARSRGTDCQFVLVGPDEDGVRLDPAVVRYLGALERAELLDAIDACDVFVLPSSYESFGLVFLEAWMRRKPVVGHAQADSVRELIEAGRDGETASCAEDLCRVLRVLLRDRGRRERLGKAGYEKVMARFTWDRVVDRALDILEEVRGA